MAVLCVTVCFLRCVRSVWQCYRFKVCPFHMAALSVVGFLGVPSTLQCYSFFRCVPSIMQCYVLLLVFKCPLNMPVLDVTVCF